MEEERGGGGERWRRREVEEESGGGEWWRRREVEEERGGRGEKWRRRVVEEERWKMKRGSGDRWGREEWKDGIKMREEARRGGGGCMERS